jgi:predicted RNA-binding Zn-ribbon protein involved in translation (DUF1610 family)
MTAEEPPEVPRCPACGAQVAPVRKRAKGSLVKDIVLLPIYAAVLAVVLFGIGVLSFILLLGLFAYTIFFTDYHWVCPNCGAAREKRRS